MPTARDLMAILPFLVAVTGGLIVIVVDLLMRPKASRQALGILSVLFLVLMILACLLDVGKQPEMAFSNLVVADDFSRFLGVIFAVAAALSGLVAIGRLPERGAARGEFYALLLFATGGACLLTQATDLISMLIGLECLSIPAYILAASLRRDPRSAEAGFKYFILGAFATGFLVYGIALLYGAAGSTQLAEIARLCATQPWTENLLLVAGALLVLVGLLFKIAAVPFHMWAPDVYQGSPTPATAFFATAVKAAAFAALLRVLFMALPDMRTGPAGYEDAGWASLLTAIAILTMTVAILIALVQNDVKRLLAYSSIAHAGYMLMAVAIIAMPGSPGAVASVSAVLVYVLIYLFMNLGAFGVTALVSWQTGNDNLDSFNGLFRRAPLLAVAMLFCLMSLGGLPPFAGFIGKWWILWALAEEGGPAGLYWIMIFVAVLNTLISLYYYLRVVVRMALVDDEQAEVRAPAGATAMVTVCGLLLILILVFSRPVKDTADRYAVNLFAPTSVMTAEAGPAPDPVLLP
jgi:NADH-quinone oxidoreductase subunit N